MPPEEGSWKCLNVLILTHCSDMQHIKYDFYMGSLRMKPLISIVIPVYNTEKYLRECLDSLISQTYRELEIICVDDGSTDSSREIICEYRKKDARIHLVTQEHKNAGAARNKGLEVAEGEFIAFLDSDDFFEAAMVEKMIEKAVSTQADCVICRCIYYDDKEKFYNDKGLARFQNAQIPDWDHFSKADIPDYIFQLTPCAWDKLYRMSFIRKNKLLFQEQRTNNDTLFVYKSYILAERMAVCSDVAVRYRTNNSESLQGSWGSWWCLFNAFEVLKDWLWEKGVLEQVNRSFVNRAALSLTNYIEKFTEWDSYAAFFEYLKNEGIRKLGLLPHEESFYYNPAVYKKIEYIFEHSCYEYLLYSHVALKKECAFRISMMKEKKEKLQEKLQEISRINQSKYWHFQESRLPAGSRVIIYGYGDVGHDLAEQLSNSRRLYLEAAADQNYEKYSGGPIAVRSAREIYTMVFDYVIIAIRDKEAVEEIRNMLIGGGICQEKVIWFEMEE